MAGCGVWVAWGGYRNYLVQSAGHRVVQGPGCRVQGAGCRVQGAGCRVQGTQGAGHSGTSCSDAPEQGTASTAYQVA